MKRLVKSVLAGAFMALSSSAAFAEITVAYFLEWPMPFLAAKANGDFEKALGTKINWRSFETGTAMSAAMASGDVQISVSQGLPPFVVAASAGQDLQVVDIAVSYSDNDNCVVKTALEVTKENASELSGKKVAVPLGTAAHYGFLRQMDHFKVPLSSLTVVNMAPPEGAAALEQGAVDFACGWGGGLARMKEHGNVLLTGGVNVGGYGRDRPTFWLSEGKAQDPPSHFAFAAENRAQVDAFHEAAIAAGGKDNGEPGLRPIYHEHYYGAFVLDPDGNNIEAVCHTPEQGI